MQILDIDALRQTPLNATPFSFVTFPGFIKPETREAIQRDFPQIHQPGSFPVSELKYGPAFAALLDELRSKELTLATSEKFDVDLSNHPLLITVRGQCRRRDGKIHTDSVWKIISFLIYLNKDWHGDGGRLRLLRSNNMEDMAAEAEPDFGNVVAFKRSEHSYHGHRPYDGERRLVQLNWVVEQKWVEKELSRHRQTARVKKLLPFLSDWGY